MRLLSIITRFAIRCLVKLHPRAFRADFGDEIQAVVSANLADAQAHGAAAVARASGLEVLGLGASLVREQWNHFDLRGPGPAGAFGWNGLAVAVTFLMLRLGETLGSGWTVGAILLAGATCGLLLRPVGRSRRCARDRAGLGGMVFLVGEFTVDACMDLIAVCWAPDRVLLSPLAKFVVEPIVLSACAAALFAFLCESGHASALPLLVRASLASVSGVVAGVALLLVIWTLSQMLDSWRVGYNGSLSPWVAELNQTLSRFGTLTVAGWFAGGRLRTHRSQPASADPALA